MLKKFFLIGIISIIILMTGIYTYLNFNSPLTAQPTASQDTDSRHVQLLKLENTSSFGNIQIEEVTVNNVTAPQRAYIQVSSLGKGFVVSDHPAGEEESPYTFRHFDAATIPTSTNSQAETDPMYALTLGHENKMTNITITYRHLGLTHQHTVSIEE